MVLYYIIYFSLLDSLGLQSQVATGKRNKKSKDKMLLRYR